MDIQQQTELLMLFIGTEPLCYFSGIKPRWLFNNLAETEQIWAFDRSRATMAIEQE
jgi:hypothetical protein